MFLCQGLRPDLAPSALAIIADFRFSVRFLDNLLSLKTPNLTSLLFTTDTLHGLHGIYPPALRVEPQLHAHFLHRKMPFLDLLLVPVPGADSCRLLTRMYDKRVQPAFTNVHLSRFVHSASNTNESCKRNILTSQFHRLRRVITDPHNFCLEIALVIRTLASQSYPVGRMVAQLRDLVTASPFRYHHARRNPSFNLFETARAHIQTHQPSRAAR